MVPVIADSGGGDEDAEVEGDEAEDGGEGEVEEVGEDGRVTGAGG